MTRKTRPAKGGRSQPVVSSQRVAVVRSCCARPANASSTAMSLVDLVLSFLRQEVAFDRALVIHGLDQILVNQHLVMRFPALLGHCPNASLFCLVGLNESGILDGLVGIGQEVVGVLRLFPLNDFECGLGIDKVV